MSKTAKKTPKLPPMEAIVTRNRSAQLQRQLRNSDQSMRKIIQITRLLRSPAKTNEPSRSPKRANKSPKVTEKSPKKKGNNEYYPNKLKRSVKAKKILLKPKHEMKRIAVGVSKRKLGVPQKELKSPIKRMRTEPDRLMQADFTIEELVRMTEESQTLNDEDLMEILTCESPVWWEDPPDEGYIEDPIIVSDKPIEETKSDHSWSVRKRRKDTCKPKKHNAEQLITKTDDDSLKILEVKKSDDKFMKKRTKLENLLSNIKNKLSTETEEVQICLANNLEENTDTIHHFDKNESKIMKIDDIEAINDKINVNKLITNKNGEKSNIKAPQIGNKSKSQSESEGEDIFSSFRDEEILRDLENVDIPIGETNNGCEDSSSNKILKTECTDTLNLKDSSVNTSVDNKHLEIGDKFIKTENKPLKSENVTLKDNNDTESKVLESKICKTGQEIQESGCKDSKDTEMSDSIVQDENLTKAKEDIHKGDASNKSTDPNEDLKDIVAKVSDPSTDNPENDNIPTTLPVLSKYPATLVEKSTVSPISVKSVVSEDYYDTSSVVSNVDAVDTISDTNIRFIDDEDSNSKHSETSLRDTGKSEVVKENVDATEKPEVDSKLSTAEGNTDTNLDSKTTPSESNPVKLKPKSMECMTVYKIISGDNMDVNSKDIKQKTDKGTEVPAKVDKDALKCNEKVEYQNGNLNAFFKICKSSYQRRGRKLETVNDTQKTDISKNTQTIDKKEIIDHRRDVSETIIVSDTNNVKYCRKCSSIFDTEICGYCNRKEEMTTESSGSKTVEKQFSCDLCEFRTSCKSDMVQHVTEHD